MADIAIFRINYKSDFILTLNSDAGWETPFCIKFWTGVPSQAYFAGFDGTTYTHCAPVEGEPTKLVVQFDDHHLPIGDLKFQIGYHFTVADFPTSVEDEVLNQASVIIEVDDAPAQVMLDFNGETAPDIEFSLPAYANEAQRIANEEQRIQNEQARISAENERISNEDARIAEEQQRISQEAARVSEFAQLKEESQQATSYANAAAALANEKAVLAQQKATYAQTQGDYAKAQGDIAKADHERAESDHTTAAADHTTAGNDHTRAESDHGIAADDHTRAESDHTRAESDHESVEVYVDSLGAFDISAYNATGGVLAKYADLTAALGTNGANIPDALRKGGMSVKFVQSSDNKYVQYRLMANDWSIDTNDWSICSDTTIVENPEFVEVHTDANGRIAWGVNTDGNFFFGAGTPRQVKEYLEAKIAELNLTSVPDILTFLGNIEETTLADLLAGKVSVSDFETALAAKVNKEEGKSLIDATYASMKSVVESSEYAEVKINSDEQVIEGIKRSGRKVVNIPVDTPSASFDSAYSPEWVKVILDKDGRVLEGIRKDGTKVFNIPIIFPDNKLAGKILSILGDSISTFGVPDQDNATGTWTYPGNRCRYPQSNLLSNVDFCYWKRLIDKYKMVLGINESWAGSLVSNQSEEDEGDVGPNRCISSQTRINHLGLNGIPDIILVYAGTNDAGNSVTIGTFNTESPKNYTDEQIAALPVATFADAYRAMLIRLLKTYPTSRVIVLLPNFTSTYYTITNLDRYVECIKEECDFFGIKYVDTRTAGITIYNGQSYLPDGTHPNAVGMELLYKLIDSEIFKTY